MTCALVARVFLEKEVESTETLWVAAIIQNVNILQRFKKHKSMMEKVNKKKWEGLQDKMIDAMVRMEKAFKEYIRKLD